MMFEDVNQDVYRLEHDDGTFSDHIIVHGYQIRATREQEDRIRRLTVEQRMDLLVRLAVIQPHDPAKCLDWSCDHPACSEDDG